VRKARRVVVVSEFTRREVVDLYGVEPKRIDVIPNGVADSFRPLAPEERAAVRARHAGGTPFFLHAGALHPRKNAANLLRAFETSSFSATSPARR
jgi:alpha-1,3-rhamnosyl/mannosyltransferase